jgi:hypothetical protein
MIQPPIDLTPTTVADWLEACLLLEERDDRLADAEVEDALKEAGVDECDAHLANLRAEVKRRGMLLADRYPIKRDGTGFARQAEWKDCLPYSFLLLISLNQLYRQLTFAGGSATVPAELFEYLTSSALKQYVGGDTIRIGAPRRPPVPTQFPDAVRHVANELAETCGYGDLEIQQSGDDGVDIVVWKRFVDGRSSQLVVLAQCAIGTDWKEKRSDLDQKVWSRHIRWATGPLTAFAVPFHHESGGSWEETAVRGGIILDRGRIVAHLPDPALSAGELTKVRKWCEARIKKIKKMADGK